MGIPDEGTDWKRADEVFSQLLEVPPTLRPVRLADMQLTATVRVLVERMLAALQEGSGGILDEPGRLAALLQADALAGRQLGRWRLQREIGRGGMSVVYRAESTEGPAGQVAAVKVLTLGALAGSGNRQFLREQESLLRLRHPDIAPLFDAGIADDGTPWLAMALVEGTRIDRWCERQGTDTAGKVGLVLQVCAAVAHAHRNLLIHRDIKPSNVLVDEDGRVRLLDFGIARAVDSESELTTTALRALTPGYAAPEQVAGATPATTMDVYGAGALLYRLVEGSAPSPGGIDRLRGDLGAILGKALAVDPALRYPTIDAFAADLGNWREGRPVVAHAPSIGYRMRKFVARHKLLLAGVGALVLLLAAGVASTVYQMQRARGEAARALAAQQRAEAAREESEAHRKYMSRVFAVLVPSKPGDREREPGKIIDQLAADAREQFEDRTGLLSSVELDLGIIARTLEQHDRSLGLLESALQRRLDLYGKDHLLVAEAQGEIGALLRSGEHPDLPKSAEMLGRALEVFRAHDVPATTQVPKLMTRAIILQQLGRNDEAWADIESAEAFCDRGEAEDGLCDQVLLYRGIIAGRTGRTSEAIGSLEALYEQRARTQGESHANTLVAGSQLAEAYLRAGDTKEAVALLEDLRIRQREVYPPHHGELIISGNLLARGYLHLGRVVDARALFQQVLDAALERGEGSNYAATAYLDLGLLEHRDGNYAKALEWHTRALEVFTRNMGPDSQAVAAVAGYRADALREMGKPREAEPLHRSSLELTRKAFGERSARVASRLANLARTQLVLGDAAASLPNYDLALELYREAQRDDPGETGVAAVLAWRSRALLALGRGPEALVDLRGAVADLERLEARDTREYREAFALLTDAACRFEAGDCGELQAASLRMSRAEQLPGRARKLLGDAGSGVPLEG